MYKGRFLVKLFLVIIIIGYILEVFGFYLVNGRNNDVFIIKNIMEINRCNILNFFNENDVLVIDRGFCDFIDFLNECGFKI